MKTHYQIEKHAMLTHQIEKCAMFKFCTHRSNLKTYYDYELKV